MISDMSFDWFGNRLAVLSDNNKITIYKYENSTWKIDYDKFENAHSGPIWKIKWAHPSFGNILATCSYDHSIIIWEEKKKNIQDKKIWIKLRTISDFQDSVEDIKFAPSHLSFILGAASSDGFVKIIDLNDKQLHNVVEFQPASKSISSLSWNKCFYEPEMIIVGCSNPKEDKENVLSLWYKSKDKGNKVSWKKIRYNK